MAALKRLHRPSQRFRKTTWRGNENGSLNAETSMAVAEMQVAKEICGDGGMADAADLKSADHES